MRIALVAPPWVPVPPPAYGGTEAVVDRLARGFVAAGHEVLLCTTGDSTCPVPTSWTLERSEGQRIGSAVPEVRHVLHAYEVVRDFDIVHDHTVAGPVFASAAVDGPAVVTTNHGPFNDELSAIYRAIGHRVPIIAVSRHQASTAEGIPIAAVIHHGVDLDELPYGDGDGGYVLFLGRMAPEKGADRAAAAARSAGVRLLIAAKMRELPEQRFFAERVRPLLGHGVEYVGEVTDAERLELLRGARALVNPIRWPEPFGLVMIEALACGTPVITFDEGAAPEIVDHGLSGFICRDEADMARSIRRIDEIDRRVCRAVAESRFATQRMVAEHLQLFEQVLARRRPRAIPRVITSPARAWRGYIDDGAGASGVVTSDSHAAPERPRIPSSS